MCLNNFSKLFKISIFFYLLFCGNGTGNGNNPSLATGGDEIVGDLVGVEAIVGVATGVEAPTGLRCFSAFVMIQKITLTM
jgi:hypothetical protein